MKYSLIVPVYNRPSETAELLESLRRQSCRDFEVIIVEDGSSVPCAAAVAPYGTAADGLTVRYLTKSNGGPGPARNFGAAEALGEWLIFLDSDVTVPEGYFDAVDRELAEKDSDAFGGPDRADDSFTPVQKAINYSMTSFFTTGGIRGGKKKLDKFYPRSFNLGIRRSVFGALGGFSTMRYGEDIDLSIRIFNGGYSCRLFPDAWVVHKRRADFRSFFFQVRHSGEARIALYKKYPSSLKAVHMLPAAFTAGCFLLVLAGFFRPVAWTPILVYAWLLFGDSTLKNGGDMKVGLLSAAAGFVQLTGYGTGFISAWMRSLFPGRQS